MPVRGDSTRYLRVTSLRRRDVWKAAWALRLVFRAAFVDLYAAHHAPAEFYVEIPDRGVAYYVFGIFESDSSVEAHYPSFGVELHGLQALIVQRETFPRVVEWREISVDNMSRSGLDGVCRQHGPQNLRFFAVGRDGSCENG